jgi:uncharacterized protein (TIGR00369 family)
MRKQPNSRMCFGCGMENPIGLKLFFYELGDGRVLARFTPDKVHEGYPGVLHGGITSALLDEVLGRVCIAEDRWMVTAKMEVRYRRPIPIGEPLTIVGEPIEERERRMTVRGEIRLPDSSVGAEATATFYALPPDKVAGMADALEFWQVVPDEDGPPEFDLL